MKTDEEMLESILIKAREKEKKMKKIKKTVAAALALAVVAGAAGAAVIFGGSGAPAVNDPASQTENSSPRAFVFAASASDEAPVPVRLESDLTLPIEGRLVFADAEGLDEEARSVLKNTLAEEESARWTAEKKPGHRSTAESENSVGVLASSGGFILFVEDADSLDSIRISCSGPGRVELTPATVNGKTSPSDRAFFEAYVRGADVTVTAEEYDRLYLNTFAGADVPPGQDGMRFYYGVTDALAAESEKENFSLADVADRITVEVRYTDGPADVAEVDITFDADGRMTATAAG